MPPRLNFVFLGLSITSSWGNGHATTYRSLLAALAARGHAVTFLERDVPWYAQHRDLREMPGVHIELYDSLRQLRDRFGGLLRDADVAIVGSYVPDAIALGSWLTRHARGLVGFYDIDTPVTLAALSNGGGCEYLSIPLLRRYGLYLSFTGGPTLRRLEALGARHVRPLYCSVDPDAHRPMDLPSEWDLGYLGTYASDRQPALDELMLDVARRQQGARFVVAGPQYPADIRWPANVDRLDHLGPAEHSRFYSRQRFTLNLTRRDMRRLGYSPSVRLFEAAACGAALITDVWPGLSDFFEPFLEILPATHGRDVEGYLRDLPEAARVEIAERARERVLTTHTAAHRGKRLEEDVCEILGTRPWLTGSTSGRTATAFSTRPHLLQAAARTKP